MKKQLTRKQFDILERLATAKTSLSYQEFEKNTDYSRESINSVVRDLSDLGYVKDGLQFYYDGINNTRNGHNENTSVWEDLSGNEKDVNISITANKYWKSDALKFENTNEMITLPNSLLNIINGDKFTMQFIFSEYEYVESDYPTILWSQNDNFSFYTVKNEWDFFRLKNGTNNRPAINKDLAIDKLVTVNFNLNNNSFSLSSTSKTFKYLYLSSSSFL